MRKKISKTASRVLACAVSATMAFSGMIPSYADSGGFITEDFRDGTAITGITDEAVSGGTVTIPDTLDGKDVIRLGGLEGAYGFLGRAPVEKVIIGANVSSITTNAFWGAKDLAEIDTSENDRFEVSDGAFLAKAGVLIKYLSPTERTDYTVPDTVTQAYNMDYAEWNLLDLNNVSSMYQLTLAGSDIGQLNIGSDLTVQGSHDILYGATVGSFSTEDSSGYETNGDALWYGDRLIKLSADAKAEDFDSSFFDGFTSVSPYAFNSLAQYRELENMIPEGLVKNTVFSFFTQDEAVFMVNGEISFCYDYEKDVPTNVNGVVDYSPAVDEEKYDRIKALMYVGVPFDGTGLFEEVFGVPYAEIANDPEETAHGDAALNAVSAMVYDVIDGIQPQEIRGTGYGVFTEEAVETYLSRLQEAVDNYEAYNFTPGFSTEDTISFTRQDDGTYLSSPVIINTLNGAGEIDNGYVYTVNIKTDGITVADTGLKSFKTGDSVSFRSQEKPETIEFTYNEPSLKYYNTSAEYQDILVSAMKEAELQLDVTVTVDDLIISKVDAATGKELPGASLTLKKDGEVYDEWISTDTPHIIPNPPDGTYELIEVTAPEGYEVAESITFEIEDGIVIGGPVIMRDQPKTPEKGNVFHKTDAATGKELPGAEIVITTEDGTEIDRWISADEPHTVYGLEDGNYVMTEITAPDGYEIAESIEFEVLNGEVVGGPIFMEDAPEEATPSTPSEPDEPDTPDTPDEPDKPATPSTPDDNDDDDDNGTHGGHSGGGGGGGSSWSDDDSEHGPGVTPEEETPTPTPTPDDNTEGNITTDYNSTPEESQNLPKTSDIRAAGILAAASAITVFILLQKRKKIA